MFGFGKGPPPSKSSLSGDGRVQMKITNTAPPDEEQFEAEMPVQPTVDIKTYLKTTPRVKKDD